MNEIPERRTDHTPGGAKESEGGGIGCTDPPPFLDYPGNPAAPAPLPAIEEPPD
jgi:hypothetical protein